MKAFSGAFCAVIGFGKMGRLIGAQLTELNVDWISVDPKASTSMLSVSYSDIGTLPSHIKDKITHIFICVPTQLHQKVLEQTLEEFPHTSIMLEKPVCSPGDFDWFCRAVGSDAFKGVWINNHYVECSNILRMSEIIQNRRERICLEVGFYKNRASDNAAGRFIDKDFLVWGYEGFHMLTIVAMLLAKAELLQYFGMNGRAYHKYGERSDISWAMEDFILESGNSVLLKSSTNGLDITDVTEPNLYSEHRRSRKVFVSFPGLQEEYELVFGQDLHDHTLPGLYYSIKGAQIEPVTRKENPLLKHIEKFLNSSLNDYSSIEFGLQVTRRLMDMVEHTYVFNGE